MTLRDRIKFPSKFLGYLKPKRKATAIFFLCTILVCTFLIPEESVLVYKRVERNPMTPKYWHACNSNWNPNGHLRTMDRVFDRLGFEFVNASHGDDWDVLWGFEYPFDYELPIYDPVFQRRLKRHQRINHIPGTFAITNKLVLTTDNYDFEFILPTFDYELKADFKQFVKENPTAKFVEKSIWNRGVKVIEKENIDFNKLDEKMFQVFLDNPMLIDGRAFDMGVYVLISSINPLRVYRYNSEMIMRFCPKPYHPFNSSDIDQYVIYETHKQYDELPSFKKYSENLGLSMKQIYDSYLREKGLNPKDVWSQVDEIIAKVVTRHDSYLTHETKSLFKSTHNFFEFVRFDFIMDEDFNLYLMEINMSPNITPETPKFEKNAVKREKMVYEVLNLIGASSKFDLMTRDNPNAMELISNPSNIAVDLKSCIRNDCLYNCKLPDCELCLNCLDVESLQDFHEFYRENSRLGGFKRVFPSEKFSSEEYLKDLTPRSKKAVKWFNAKCRNDKKFC